MTMYVVGTDGSDTAAKAAARAGELAKTAGASCHVVCAFTDRPTTTIAEGSDVYVISAFGVAEQIAERQAAEYRAIGLAATFAVREGKPAAVILEEAERVGADLIVVGNRRMQGVQRILGSVANDVAHHAPCDVLIVKTV